MGDNEPIKSNNSLLSSIDQNKCNYEESQVLLNGISQVVICGICNEEFAKTNKEYNAQKDDWILKNACYADGSTSKDGGNKDNVRKLKIVHRKCYQLKKQQQQNDLDDDDRLKPKLYDKNQTISKIEEHFNENGASLALSQIEKKQKSQKAKKRKKFIRVIKKKWMQIMMMLLLMMMICKELVLMILINRKCLRIQSHFLSIMKIKNICKRKKRKLMMMILMMMMLLSMKHRIWNQIKMKLS